MDASVRQHRRRQHQRRVRAVVCDHSGIVATVTGDGLVVPTIGNQAWFEYGGRLGFRITSGWVADLFLNGTLGPQPVGNTIHGGVGLAGELLGRREAIGLILRHWRAPVLR